MTLVGATVDFVALRKRETDILISRWNDEEPTRKSSTKIARIHFFHDVYKV